MHALKNKNTYGPIRPLQIGKMETPNNVWLAPMAGYSGKSLRIMAKRHGAGLTYTEMVSLEGLVRRDKKTWEYLNLEEDGRTVIQVFGRNEPQKYYSASMMIQSQMELKALDVNFGCPVRKVIRNGCGSALLKTPKAMGDIVRALKDSGIAVSAKIRSGFDEVNIEETVTELDRAGADVIILHPRLAIHFYNGKADWDLIRRARGLTDKILIASGDIRTPSDAEKVFEHTGADGIMIGRQAVGSVFLFGQILDYFKKGSFKEYGHDEIKAAMMDYAELFSLVEQDESIVPIRSALIQYIRLYRNSREIRNRLSKTETIGDLKTVLADW
jgi:tRNA-dihydrouridine synthase B